MNKKTLYGLALLLFAIAGIAIFQQPRKQSNLEELRSQGIENYVQLVSSRYQEAYGQAQKMHEQILEFRRDPSAERLNRTRQAWIAAREAYSPTEAYRFYSGPIDHPDTGVEGLLNAWPLDEAYVDYVQGEDGILQTGLISDEDFEITKAALEGANERNGEKNISTGYHAIEFILWGQDFRSDGPGNRPLSDFTEAPFADRRLQYLVTSSELLLDHLGHLKEAWDLNQPESYAQTVLQMDQRKAYQKILTGIFYLSGEELAGERMFVAYDSRSQEDEQSCFSDQTHRDLIRNAEGILEVYGKSIQPALEVVNPELALELEKQMKLSIGRIFQIPTPLDQVIIDSDDESPGRKQMMEAIVSLRKQAELIKEAAEALDAPLLAVEA